MAQASNQPEEQTEASAAGRRPVAKFSGFGGVSVAVWKHNGDGGYDNYSAKIERSYKDEQGNWQQTDYLRDGDLLRVEKLLQQADQFIEQDKGRGHSQATAAGRH